MGTMAEATQAWQVAKEMKEFGIEAPGISETRVERRWYVMNQVASNAGVFGGARFSSQPLKTPACEAT